MRELVSVWKDGVWSAPSMGSSTAATCPPQPTPIIWVEKTPQVIAPPAEVPHVG